MRAADKFLELARALRARDTVLALCLAALLAVELAAPALLARHCASLSSQPLLLLP